jgi:hypothetical protein
LGYCLLWIYRYTEYLFDIGPIPITPETIPGYLELLFWARWICWVLAGLTLVDVVIAWRRRSPLRVQKVILGVLTVHVILTMHMLMTVMQLQLGLWIGER